MMNSRFVPASEFGVHLTPYPPCRGYSSVWKIKLILSQRISGTDFPKTPLPNRLPNRPKTKENPPWNCSHEGCEPLRFVTLLCVRLHILNGLSFKHLSNVAQSPPREHPVGGDFLGCPASANPHVPTLRGDSKMFGELFARHQSEVRILRQELGDGLLTCHRCLLQSSSCPNPNNAVGKKQSWFLYPK